MLDLGAQSPEALKGYLPGCALSQRQKMASMSSWFELGRELYGFGGSGFHFNLKGIG